MNASKIIASVGLSAMVLLGTASVASAKIDQNGADPCEAGPLASEWCADPQGGTGGPEAKPGQGRPTELCLQPTEPSSAKVAPKTTIKAPAPKPAAKPVAIKVVRK